MTVGERIRELRELREMSQEDLAIKMGYKGRSSISKIEKYNDDQMTLEIVQKASEILSCSPLYLIGWNKEPAPSLRSDEEQLLEGYNLLDQEDQAEIRGEIKGMLKQEKYKKDSRKEA